MQLDSRVLQVVKALQVRLVHQVHLVEMGQGALLAFLELLDRLVLRALQEHLVPLVYLAQLVHRELQGRLVRPEPRELEDRMEPLVQVVKLDRLAPQVLLVILVLLEVLGLQVQQDLVVPQELQGQLEVLELPDQLGHKAQVGLLEPRVQLVPLD